MVGRDDLGGWNEEPENDHETLASGASEQLAALTHRLARFEAALLAIRHTVAQALDE